jgi:hypothetical protein
MCELVTKLALGISLHHLRSPFGSAVRLRFILQTISKEIDMKTLGELLRDKINASIEKRRQLELQWWDAYKEVYNVRPRWIDISGWSDAKLVEELDALSRPAEHEHSMAKYEQNN